MEKGIQCSGTGVVQVCWGLGEIGPGRLELDDGMVGQTVSFRPGDKRRAFNFGLMVFEL